MTKIAKHIVLGTAGLCLIGLMNSCTLFDKNNDKENQPDDISCFRNYNAANEYQLVGTAQEYNLDSDVIVRDSVSIVMPERLNGIDVAQLRDSIMMIALDTIGFQNPADAIRAYFDASLNDEASDPGTVKSVKGKFAVSPNNSYTMVDGVVRTLSADMFVYSITSTSYGFGAAHPMYNVIFINYSMKYNKILTLAELFTPQGLKELPGLIDTEAHTGEDADDIDKITSLPSYNNFYISEENEIVFVYQPYEVGPYALGVVEVPIYAFTVTEYLTPLGRELLAVEDM